MTIVRSVCILAIWLYRSVFKGLFVVKFFITAFQFAKKKETIKLIHFMIACEARLLCFNFVYWHPVYLFQGIRKYQGPYFICSNGVVFSSESMLSRRYPSAATRRRLGRKWKERKKWWQTFHTHKKKEKKIGLSLFQAAFCALSFTTMKQAEQKHLWAITSLESRKTTFFLSSLPKLALYAYVWQILM